jgi:hypothetical protein
VTPLNSAAFIIALPPFPAFPPRPSLANGLQYACRNWPVQVFLASEAILKVFSPPRSSYAPISGCGLSQTVCRRTVRGRTPGRRDSRRTRNEKGCAGTQVFLCAFASPLRLREKRGFTTAFLAKTQRTRKGAKARRSRPRPSPSELM